MPIRVSMPAIAVSLAACVVAVQARAAPDAETPRIVEHTSLVPTQAPPAPGLFRLKPAVQAVNCQNPVYPRQALNVEAQGSTRLRIGFSADGRVVSTEVLASSGRSEAHKLLDQAAIASQQTCTLPPEPGTLVRYAVRSVTFALPDDTLGR
jgi:TonB family protein